MFTKLSDNVNPMVNPMLVAVAHPWWGGASLSFLMTKCTLLLMWKA
jgi:hypothetical protein